MIEPQLTAKKIVYPLEVDESAPRVVADLERLQQIFINLIANSIKSTPPEGSIRVSARRRDREVEERVNDSGPGIPADKVGSLFSPFVQLGDGKSAGTGSGDGRRPGPSMRRKARVQRSSYPSTPPIASKLTRRNSAALQNADSGNDANALSNRDQRRAVGLL